MKKAIPSILLSILAISIIAILLLSFKVSNNNPVFEFLDSLDDKQLKKVNLHFDDASRTIWHYLPNQMLWRKREGIPFKELNEKQRDISSRMLRKYLSESGYAQTKKIIELESVLAVIENDPEVRDSENYFIAIYGNPKKDIMWAWSFEGHHLSLNFTIVNNKVVASPRFFGANPANIQQGRKKDERTLNKEEDLAYELMGKLTEQQKQKAIFRNTTLFEIVTADASKIDPLKPVGIQANELTLIQKAILKNLIAIHLSSLPEQDAVERENKIFKEEFDEIRFAWAGGLKKGTPHYYLIQGKSFLIEFVNVQDYANHIHTVWRDFDGDFGRDLIKKH